MNPDSLLSQFAQFYHVAIRLESSGNAPVYEFVFDLDRASLDQRFIIPYCNGEEILIQGKTVVRDDINHIRISETTLPSSHLRSEVQQEVEVSLQRDILYKGMLSDFPNATPSYLNQQISLGIMDKGKDVTDEMITSTAIVGSDTSVNDVQQTRPPTDPHKVFVVHGRNLKARDAMFIFLGAIGLDPIEWSEATKATGKPSPYIG